MEVRKIARPKNKIKTPNTTVKMSAKEKKKMADIDFALQSVVGEGMKMKEPRFRNTKITKSTIERYLNNPQKNYLELQNLSNYFYNSSGIYQALIDHFAYLPKFYHSIVPIGNLLQPSSKVDLKKYHYENAVRCENLSIRKNASRFSLDLFINGESFYYKIEDKKGILFQRLENDVCTPISVEIINGAEVIRVAIDMSKLNKNNICYYPDEIQKAFELYEKGNINNDSFIDKFYIVSNKAFCITLNKEGRGIPPLVYLLPFLLNIESKKSLQDKTDVFNSTKMIKNQIPVNSKDGKPILDTQLAKAYNDAIKSNLIERNLEDLISITNPLETSILNLDTNKGANAISLVKTAKSDYYDEIGTSEFLFNSDKGGAEAIKRSIIEDSGRTLNKILFLIGDYFTSQLADVKGFIKYKVSMKESTQHNEFEKAKQSKEELAFGYPVLEHYANLGHTPLESINLLLLEKELGIKEWLTPIQSSHTQSNKDNAGRKSADDMRENGETVSEKTEAKENSGEDYS